MQGKFVAPGNNVVRKITAIRSQLMLQKFIGNWPDSQRVFVYNHVFQFNSKGFEQTQLTHFINLILLMNVSMMVSYSFSLGTLSSMPASMLGLSFISIT